MAKDVSVVVDDPLGEPARQAEATAASGVDIEGARRERGAIRLDVEDHPGTRAQLMREAADATMNIDLPYPTSGRVRLVVESTTSNKGARGGLSQASRVPHARLTATGGTR